MFMGETYSHCSQLRLNINICTPKYLAKIKTTNRVVTEMIGALGKYANIMNIMLCTCISI